MSIRSVEPNNCEEGDANKLSALKLCYVKGDADGTLGLHLSRTPWDPYPWISGVSPGSSADLAGIKTGDCVLEVNGEDLLGQKIMDVAKKVRDKNSSPSENGVTLLLWNSGYDKNNLNPQSLSRFANCLQNIAGLLECPVCFEIIRPPSWQCCHGHLICSNCRSRSNKCPICRVILGRGRCIVADKLFNFLALTLGNEDKNPSHHIPPSSNLVQINARNDMKQPHKLKVNKYSKAKSEASKSETDYYCPSGQPCAKMENHQNILVHLQKTHQIAVVQYYCAIGDNVKINFNSSSIICLVLPNAIDEHMQHDVFFISRFRHFDCSAEGLFWMWYIGDKMAEQFVVHLISDNPNLKWIGKPVSLKKSFTDVVKLKSLGKFNYNLSELIVKVDAIQ